MRRSHTLLLWAPWLGLLAGCDSARPSADSGSPDACTWCGSPDGGADAGFADSGSPDGGDGGDSGTPDAGGGPVRRTPPALAAYSGGTCPTLNAGPTKALGKNPVFRSSGDDRAFTLLVPSNYDGTSDWPVFFGYHWLNASASSLVSDAELESAAAQMGFIAVVPERLEDSGGNHVYQFDWPFVETWGAPKELTFFDDLLTCVSQQLRVDQNRVYAFGASAGGLWVTYLSSTDRVDRLAAVLSISGGLGEQPFVWKMDFTPRPNKFPAQVVWGGPSDWLAVDFAKASARYRDALLADGHFVVTCTHDQGHAIPPVEPTDGGTLLEPFWRFFLDHPYGYPGGYSPYADAGLPASFPSWCARQ